MTFTTGVEPQPTPEWRSFFKTPSEMSDKGVTFLVDGFLTEGTTIIGGLSGHGKTWVAASLAKALYTGEKFLGYFEVLQRTPVVYLAPEAGEASLKSRLTKLGLGTVVEDFYVRTLADGRTSLQDPKLLDVVKSIQPVVFLDTAIRFSKGTSENDANQTRMLSDDIFSLLSHGAVAVIPLHHSSKASRKVFQSSESISLEDVLRGSGEYGAMADVVYSVFSSDEESFQVVIRCHKDRDLPMGKLPPFTIQGRPYIDQTGDFKMIVPPAVANQVQLFNEVVTNNPKASHRQIESITGIPHTTVARLARRAGWKQENGIWTPPGVAVN